MKKHMNETIKVKKTSSSNRYKTEDGKILYENPWWVSVVILSIVVLVCGSMMYFMTIKT